MNFYNGTKEVTIELSDTKWVSGANLPAHWTYNKQAFLDLIKQANYGIQGFVTDESGNPVVAKIEIVGHDRLNTFRKASTKCSQTESPKVNIKPRNRVNPIIPQIR